MDNCGWTTRSIHDETQPVNLGGYGLSEHVLFWSIGRNGSVRWPQISPDLNAVNYYLWDYPKCSVFRQSNFHTRGCRQHSGPSRPRYVATLCTACCGCYFEKWLILKKKTRKLLFVTILHKKLFENWNFLYLRYHKKYNFSFYQKFIFFNEY
jgi:hypothetical protein